MSRPAVDAGRVASTECKWLDDDFIFPLTTHCVFTTLPLLVLVTELVSGEVLSRDQPGDYPGFSEGNQCQMRKMGYPMSSHAQIEARGL